ncbi:MAG: HEAT repeat domain-containing protein [Elusimicrobiaceae bacterium]|nr:HEAT repeat domain-containing protein [Elusimicrobiaceae bacterium]
MAEIFYILVTMKKFLFLLLIAALAGCASSARKKCGISRIPMLEAADDGMKISAARQLGACGGAAAMEPLSALLGSGSEPVRDAAVNAIASIGGDSAAEPLSTALRQDKAGSVRLAAAQGLAQYQDGRAERALVRALVFDPRQDVRAEAAAALESCCAAKQYPVVYTGTDDWGDPGILVEVAGPPGELATTAAGALAFALFNDPSYLVRTACARALSRSETQGAQAALVQALGSDNSARVRSEAAAALGNMGDMDAEPALIAAQNDTDQQVRDSASLALANLTERF